MMKNGNWLLRELEGLRSFSPEARYLLIVLYFDLLRKNNNAIDVRIARLTQRFGATPKVIAEVLVHLEACKAGVVHRDSNGNKTFHFHPETTSKLRRELSKPSVSRVSYLFFSAIRENVDAIEALHGVKLRNSNLLLIAIFLMHSDDLGYVQGLSDHQIQMLMGGIASSRLKSQIDTLSRVGFLKVIGKGGVNTVYFGKFTKRYMIKPYFPYEGLSTQKNHNEIKKNASIATYDIPHTFVIFKPSLSISFFPEFEFDFPIKLAHFLQSIRGSNAQSKKIADLDLSMLNLSAFQHSESSALAIVSIVEELTSFMLVEHWSILAQVNYSDLSMNEISSLQEKMLADGDIKKLIETNRLFTDKYRKEKGEEFLKCEGETLSRLLILISINLSVHLIGLLCKMKIFSGKVHNLSVIIYNVKSYKLTRPPRLPSCDVSVCFSCNNEVYNFDIIASCLDKNVSECNGYKNANNIPNSVDYEITLFSQCLN
ncbi:hypothetical protein KW482_20545 [Vibrio fluvialis]|nr:hypothetical protein [Vibrio fluvialis]